MVNLFFSFFLLLVRFTVKDINYECRKQLLNMYLYKHFLSWTGTNTEQKYI